LDKELVMERTGKMRNETRKKSKKRKTLLKWKGEGDIKLREEVSAKKFSRVESGSNGQLIWEREEYREGAWMADAEDMV
jgi:hypothetical protein